MNELNEKLLKFAGFVTYNRSAEFPHIARYADPNGKFLMRTPNFPSNLNACFEWLVPKGGIDDIDFIFFASSWGAMSCIIEAGPKKYQSCAGTPSDKITPALVATALCLAFETLIDSENPGGVESE